jgi:hypothetical protein
VGGWPADLGTAEHRITALEQGALRKIRANTIVHMLLARARATNLTDEPPEVEA